ncbi:probable caffeoyl-CoA O-methyltransferase At4g26220 isoform X2 [Rhodamnia argentea]|uniref:Probable caffeoyl-CoA O-methyltransferase At4g26220 isoform X2 n=1 Tax=Rhodamnia argentea TaxID=178133 RepID=A0ABM3H963_9MYRT|nr:probable caffeoyl-CoA O-methyltransferase At4g26220 isoform X2 [Rhodamnia argentea]
MIFLLYCCKMYSEMEHTAKVVSHGPSGLLQSDELYDYVLTTSVYPREAEILKELRDAIANHPQSYMATAPDGGQFMALLLKLLNAKKTIEVGVFTGYSLLLTALTIPHDGKIIAIDVDREAYEIGLPFIKKANVEHKVNFVESQGLPVLDKLLENQENESSFDFAFVDADRANLKNYHERLLRLVRVGGVIMYDNTLWGGTVTLADLSAVHPMRQFAWKDTIEFNKMIAGDPRVDISQVALGDGMTICRRIC